MKKLIVIFIFICLIQACFSENSSGSEPQKKYVRIGLYNNHPLIYLNDSGKPEGFYVEIINYIATRENWEIEYIPGSWQDCLNRLEWNQINILPAIAYSQEREKIYDFSQETVLVNWGQVYTPEDSDIKTFLDLDNKKLGVLNNDIYYKHPNGITDIERSYKLDYDYVEFNSYNAIFSALEKDSLAAGVFNRLFKTGQLEGAGIKRTSLIFNPIEIRFAFPKGVNLNSLLIPQIDNWLRILKEDKNSTYYKAQNRYINITQKQPEKISRYFLITLLILLFGFIIFLILNHYLNLQIKKRSRQLKESEAKFHDLYNMFRLSMDNVPDMIWAKDLNNDYMFANKAMCNKLLMAKDPMEPIGRSDRFFGERQRKLHPDDPEWYNFDLICSDSDEQTLTSRTAQQFVESGFVNGRHMILDVRKSPFWDDNNQLIGTVGSAREITEQKQLEEEKNQTLQELHEREIFNFALFEYNPVETIVVDKNCRIIKINQAVKEQRSHAPKIGDVLYKDYASRYTIDMHSELLTCINNNENKAFPEIEYGNGKIFFTHPPIFYKRFRFRVN